MASQGTAPSPGPDTIDALTADRQKTWTTFTSATAGVVVFVVVVLSSLAWFLL